MRRPTVDLSKSLFWYMIVDGAIEGGFQVWSLSSRVGVSSLGSFQAWLASSPVGVGSLGSFQAWSASSHVGVGSLGSFQAWSASSRVGVSSLKSPGRKVESVMGLSMSGSNTENQELEALREEQPHVSCLGGRPSLARWPLQAPHLPGTLVFFLLLQINHYIVVLNHLAGLSLF